MRRTMRSRVALAAKKALAPILYRHRPLGLSAGTLYLYLDAIYRTAEVPGAVVEIGCMVCGTSTLGRQLLRKMRSERPYVCIDTFAGFIEEQHADDMQRGNPGDKRYSFAANDMALARRVLELHNCADVELIQADICQLDPDRIPRPISVCLVDVDLYEPVLAALEKVYPRMQPGGIILIDDCSENPRNWRAGDALRDFVTQRGIDCRVEFGMGVISIPQRVAETRSA